MKKSILFLMAVGLLIVTDSMLFSQTACSYTWSLIGNQSGYISGVAFTKSIGINSQDRIFIGTEENFIFTKTVSDDPYSPWDVRAWQVDYGDPDVRQLLINSKDYMFIRAYNTTPQGIFCSKDNGLSWDLILEDESPSVTSIEVSFQDVFYHTSSYTGFWFSYDNGETFDSIVDWENAPEGFDWTALRIAANNNRVIVENEHSHSIYYGKQYITYFSWDDFIIRQFDINSTGQLFTTFYDSTGIFFADTTGKYSVFEKKGLDDFNDDEICKIIIDRKDYIYVGTDNGLYFSANNGGTWSLIGLSDYRIIDFAVNRKGNIAVLCNNNTESMFDEVYFGEKSVSSSIIVLDPSDVSLQLRRGEEYDVRWQSSGSVGETVSIELYKDGVYNRTIQIETENDGFYTWRVPLPLSIHTGSTYQIKITDKDNPSVYNYGRMFSVVAGDYEEEVQVYSAPKIPDTMIPVLDGRLNDLVWGYLQEDTLRYTGPAELNPQEWTDFEDILVTWKAAWNTSQNKLYVGFSIKDDVQSVFDNGPSSENYLPFNDDAIELFIDGDHSGGDAFLEYENSQQFRVTGDNHRDFYFYPNNDYQIEEYTGEDFVTHITRGEDGDWVCEAVITVYDSYPVIPKALAIGDTIGWDIWYDDSDNNEMSGSYYKLEKQVGWFFRGVAWKNADMLGALVLAEEPANMAVSDPDVRLIPDSFAISGSYPNPFNSQTNIQILLPEDSRVTAEVYDVQGRKIKVINNGLLSQGRHSITWDGADKRGNSVPSGIYIFRIEMNTIVKTAKVIYQK